MRYPILIAIFYFTLTNCRQGSPDPEVSSLTNPEKSFIASKAGLATAHPAATLIGFDVLKDGGNAVDAAIATQFALAVCYPGAGNIGGGGFMVLRNSDGTADALDYRETAPGKAHEDMYLDAEGNVIRGLSIRGHLAAGVPGSVDGMEKAFDKYSKLKDWSRLIQPSIDLAKNGFQLTQREANSLNSNEQSFIDANTRPNRFTNEGDWKEGDLFIQPELAMVLESIRIEKGDGFYKGWVADSIVAEMQRGKGLITLDDLDNYTAIWRRPLIGEYKGYDIISMPPPSSGGIALQQLLSSVEEFPIRSYGFHSVEAIHLMVEAERRVYADRATHLGDSDFYPVPVGELMDEEYTRSRMNNFDPSTASKSEDVKAGTMADYESEETTHFSILDEEGNAVSVTTTINTGYGSKVVVGGAGFLLNNEMDDFSSKPGVPNFFGLIGNEANSIQPGKRMLSSMTPTIVTKGDQLKLVLGSPGGSTIITTVYQVILNILDFDMNAYDAVQACRFHHQWIPDNIQFEPDCLGEKERQVLEKMGHKVIDRGELTRGTGYIGRVEAILVRDDGTLELAADIRGDDNARGY